MHAFMTSMWPTDVAEYITTWLQKVQKPRHIKLKAFVLEHERLTTEK